MSKIFYISTLLFVVTFMVYEAHGQDNCLASFREIGCYRDTKRRALPTLLLNKRGKIPNFWQNYDKVLPSIICDCAKEAERKGYRVFGIQFYGECWGSHSFIPSRRYRPVRRCIDEQFKKCAKNGSNTTCTGENWANFIYKLQQPPASHRIGQKVDACTNHACENGATCKVTGKDSYRCQCPNGYFGDNCEKVDACTKAPCKNGGNCVVTGDKKYSCSCTKGFFGENCEKVNRCADKPCQNGGQCNTTGDKTYRCKCVQGYYGVDCEKDCSFPIDIALAIDASGSVGHHSFQLVREFLKLFTQHFDVSHMVRFACLHYDHFVYKDFSFKDEQFRNHTNLEEKLQNMSYPSGATLTHQALIEVIKFFGIGNGARNASEVRRVSVVLTDGRTYGGKRKLIPPVDYLKKYQHVIIVPIGVGWAVSKQELQVMAGDRRHYVLVDNFDKLANAMYEVLDLVCTW